MFKIDENTYDVGIISLQRSIDRDLKYDVTTEDGKRYRETRALYPVYQITLGSITRREYDRLYADLVNYDETHTVTLPDGQEERVFEATVELGSDSLSMLDRNGVRYWEGLSLTITGVDPIEG